MRKKRYQVGSLQRRRHGRAKVWVALWYEHGSRRYRTLGRCSKMSQGEARAKLDEILKPLNVGTPESRVEPPTFGDFVDGVYLPFARRRWKVSTAMTSEQRIRFHLVSELGGMRISEIRRDQLQSLLEKRATVGLSFSTVDHLRWDLRAIFELAVEEGGLTRNPAKLLQTPRSASVAPKRVMTSEEVVRYLSVLEFRERLIAKLAIFAGMRPGEIFGLKWGCIKNGAAKIQRRIYRGREDSPKTQRSVRVAGLTPGIVADLDRWRTFSRDSGPDAWVFPSERLTTPLSKDNCWRRCMEPKLREVGLAWANFQVMRRTLPSLGREQGADPKVVADQLGHGLGVSLDVYTQADLAQKAATVTRLENAILQ